MPVSTLLPVLGAAAQSVASAVSIFIMGIALAWKGTLDPTFTPGLSKLAGVALIPSVRFTSIATTVSLTFLNQMWPIVVYGAFVFFLGFVCAHLFLPLARTTESFRPWFVICAAFPNLVAIPLVLIEAICRNEEHTAGDVAHCVEDANARLFTVTLTSMLIMWGGFGPYAKWHSQRAAKPDGQHKFSKVVDNDTKEELKLHDVVGLTRCQQEIDSNATPSTMPDVIGNSCSKLDTSGIRVDVEQAWLESSDKSTDKILVSPQENVTKSEFFSRIKSFLADYFPIVADLCAILVGVFMQPVFYGPDAPLKFLTTSIAVVGKGAPGMTNLLAAMSLGFQLKKLEHPSDVMGSEKIGLSKWTMLVLTLTRIVVIPCINLLIVTFLVQPYLLEDKWSERLLYFMPASPTANMACILAHALNQPENAQLIALCGIPQLLLYIPTSMFFISYGIAMTGE